MKVDPDLIFADNGISGTTRMRPNSLSSGIKQSPGRLTTSSDARYAILEREAVIVQRVFHLLVNEQQSIGAIARTLRAEQIPTRRDVGKWERSVVWAIVRNPAYTGFAASRKTQAVERPRPTKQARDHSFYPKHVHSSSRDRPPAVDRPQNRSFLGFSFTGGKVPNRRKMAPQALRRFKARVRELPRRSQGRSLGHVTATLSEYLRGWRGYFGFCLTPAVFRDLDSWIRHRLRCLQWKQRTRMLGGVGGGKS